MTKLESYMVGGEFTATQFLAEVDGHPDDPPVQAGARGAGVLHHRREGARRLPGRPVPWLTTAAPTTSATPGSTSTAPRRTGDAEVVYGAGKTPQQVVGILGRLHDRHPDRAVLATRLSADAQDAVRHGLPDARRRRGGRGRRPRTAARAARTGDRGRGRHLRRAGRRGGDAHRTRPRRRVSTRSATSAWPACTGCSPSATELAQADCLSWSPAWRARCPAWSAGSPASRSWRCRPPSATAPRSAASPRCWRC